MTMQEFEKRIEAFHQIKRDMVPEISDPWWPLFKENRLGFFRIAKPFERAAIWRATNKILEQARVAA